MYREKLSAAYRFKIMKINNFKVPLQRGTRKAVELLPRFPEVLSVFYLDLKVTLCYAAILSPD